eukprot:1178166-Amphidinium_carterae.1
MASQWEHGIQEIQSSLVECDLDKAELAWSSRWESFIVNQLEHVGVEVSAGQRGRGLLGPHVCLPFIDFR